MTDREKVIYDIERCICHVPDACRDCSHYGHGEVIGCMEELLTDALALLKEQEIQEQCLMKKCVICPHCENCDVDENGLLKEQEAEPHSHMTDDSDLYFTCGKCGHVIWSEGYKFCPMCATRIAWNGKGR